MEDAVFDQALIAAAFQLAARSGWRAVTVGGAAREGALPLALARARFASREAILLRLGRLADQHALQEAPAQGEIRERLFDLLMRRFDALQPYRAGILVVLRGLPSDPSTALLLGLATADSMRWVLEGAGVPITGLTGRIASNGLLAVWMQALRAWMRDDSVDLSATMAALDRALGQAEKALSWLPAGLRPGQHAGPKPFPDPVPDAPFTPETLSP